MLSQKNFQRLRIFIWVIGPATGLLALVFVIIYLKQFGSRGISTNTYDFAIFGTFVAGTVGVCLSFVNTLLIVYLNAKIHKDDHHIYPNYDCHPIAIL